LIWLSEKTASFDAKQADHLGEAQIELTASQRDQLQAFLAEQDASEDRVRLQPAQTLPSSYVEAVLLDPSGEPTPKKRILFPYAKKPRDERGSLVLRPAGAAIFDGTGG
jgi:hypothetical protein